MTRWRLFICSGAALALAVLFVLGSGSSAQAAGGCEVPVACSVPGVSTIAGGVSEAIDFASDPAGYWAEKIAQAIEGVSSWMLDAMGRPVVLFSSATREYIGLTWGLAIALTFLLALVQVVRGLSEKPPKPAGAIAGDAVAHACWSLLGTPVLLALIGLVMAITDGVSDAMLGSFSNDMGQVGGSLSKAVTAMGPNQPFMAAFLGFLVLLPLVLIWLMLEARAALLTIGIVFMPFVFAGLSSKERWETVRKPLGALVALILLKPVVYTGLGLSAAILASNKGSDDSMGAQALVLVTGVAALFTVLMASTKIAQFVPIFGDDIRSAAKERRGPSPYSMVMMGSMATRMGRGSGGGGSADVVARNSVADGVAVGGAGAGAGAAAGAGTGAGAAAAGPAAPVVAAAKTGADAASSAAKGAVDDAGGAVGGGSSPRPESGPAVAARGRSASPAERASWPGGASAADSSSDPMYPKGPPPPVTRPVAEPRPSGEPRPGSGSDGGGS